MNSDFKIVLVAPDIPGNTGSIGRTCVALEIPLILIKPYGFDIDEKSVRRAGLDYWQHLDLAQYENWNEFLQQERPEKNQLCFFSKTAATHYYQAQFKPGNYLVFGSETKGLPAKLFSDYHDRFFSMPQKSDKIRSLNLACCATAVSYEALRQINL